MVEKNKKYSIINNLIYSYKNLIKYEGKRYFVPTFFYIISGIAFPFMAILLPSEAVKLLSGRGNKLHIFLILSVYILFLLLVKYIYFITKEVSDDMLFFFRSDFFEEVINHILHMNYEKFESSDGQRKLSAAQRAIYEGESQGIEGLLNRVPVLIINTMGLIIYSFIAADINMFIFAFIFLSTVIVSFLNLRAGKWQNEHRKESEKLFNKFKYLRDESIASKNGKDIRLYGLKDWFLNSFNDVMKSYGVFQRKLRGKYFTASSADKILTLIRDGAVYGYLIYEMMNGKLEIDKFILFVGIAAGFGVWMNEIFSATQKIVQNSEIMNGCRDFLEFGCISDDLKDAHVNKGAIHKIKLENVSYKYHGDSKYAIKHLNLTIHKGEKLALVGMNGAGKTTLVKLICGLYKPTEGKIYIDGIDISKVNRKEYFNEFAVVFQDVSAFAFSIASNVTCRKDSDIDQERMENSLKNAGLFDKVNNYPKKADTILLKELSEDGVDFSGGEMQKLMLARALYKDAPVIILDEPTAALDPIAESEMYDKYASFAENKTSIFISHRLSSTRFCDRIILFENGEIVEEGTHESLIKKNGKYAHMFEVQSHYYKEEECDKDEAAIQ